MNNGKRWMERFTFIMIRGADKPVWQKDIAKWASWALFASVLIAVIATMIWVFLLRSQYAHHVALMSMQVQREKQAQQEIIGEKNETIGQLQNQIIRLGEQADAVQRKLQEIERLEQEIRAMTGQTFGQLPQTQKTKTSSLAEGGELHDISAGAMKKYADTVAAGYTSLETQLRMFLAQLSAHKKQLDEQAKLQRIFPTIWPTVSTTITSGFGVRSDPFTKRPGFHSGIDISGNVGDSVAATADGTVEFVGSDKTHGKHLIINHGGGLKTAYLHLSGIYVKRGERVQKGEIVGALGNTGRSTGPHLHYEVVKSGTSVDPEDYLPH